MANRLMTQSDARKKKRMTKFIHYCINGNFYFYFRNLRKEMDTENTTVVL